MKGVYGLYETPQAAQRAFDGLRAAGIPALCSAEPRSRARGPAPRLAGSALVRNRRRLSLG